MRLGVGLLMLCAAAFLGRRFLDMREAFASLVAMEAGYLAPISLLAAGYYVLKGLRWHYYLRVAAVAVPLRRSLAAYLAGQWFTFTPAGELLRVYLLQAGADFARVAPTVVVQAVVDFVSLAFVATAVVPFYPALAPAVLPLTVPVLSTAAMLACPPLRRFATAWPIVRWLLSGRRAAALRQTAQLFGPGPVAVGLLMGVPTVLVGASTLYLAGRATGVPGVSPFRATGVYAMSQLLGGLSPVPQGLGVAEGTGTLLLSYLGVEPAEALAAIVVFRAATLGVGVGLGLLALLLLRLTAPTTGQTGAAGAGQSP